jgi:hypothetical protein
VKEPSTVTQKTHKATISVGDRTVTFEGPRDFVESQVALCLSLPSKPQASQTTASLGEGASQLSLAKLVESKKPRGHSEIVAVLAFGLASSGLLEFTESDMRRAYLQADVRPPKVVGQALRDAKNNKDYIEAGRKRGAYKLSTHGDRTVRFDLPRD